MMHFAIHEKFTDDIEEAAALLLYDTSEFDIGELDRLFHEELGERASRHKDTPDGAELLEDMLHGLSVPRLEPDMLSLVGITIPSKPVERVMWKAIINYRAAEQPIARYGYLEAMAPHMSERVYYSWLCYELEKLGWLVKHQTMQAFALTDKALIAAGLLAQMRLF